MIQQIYDAGVNKPLLSVSGAWQNPRILALESSASNPKKDGIFLRAYNLAFEMYQSASDWTPNVKITVIQMVVQSMHTRPRALCMHIKFYMYYSDSPLYSVLFDWV